jgi:hypothetical protein
VGEFDSLIVGNVNTLPWLQLTPAPLRTSVLFILRVSPKAGALATISVRANKPFHKTYKSYKSYENIA